MNALFITRAVCALPLAMSLLLLNASAQNATYSTAGVYTNVAPAGVSKVTVKLWGAGGGGGGISFIGLVSGGGGAFSSVTLDAQPGDTFVVVVGQRGAFSSASLGGAGSGNTQGGPPGVFNGSTNRSQGGQASSVFFLTNNLLIIQGVAGAGGGAGNFGSGGAAGQFGQNTLGAIGGEPGANGSGGGFPSAGGDYNNSALTTGISALNQAGGNGGQGVLYSGGGGGGYGGGAGGSGDPGGAGAGGGGGGSYGSTIVLGSGFTPGNTSDANYVGTAGRGGLTQSEGKDGLAVVLWIPATLPAPSLTNSARLPDGSFRFAFTNINGAPFTALAATNVVNGSNNWTVLGPVPETAPGQFQFTDPQAINYPQRFYQVRSP